MSSPVYIEKRGRRIAITTTDQLKGLQSEIPGAYETAAGYWTVPLSIESCVLLRQRFTDRLVIGNELQRWVGNVQANRTAMSELARSSDAELHVLPRVAPKLYRAMARRTYQRVGARFVADSPATLVADDPGLGKTLIAMGGILEAEVPGPYLVVAPKTAADTVWRREIRRWLPREHRAVILPENRAKRERVLRLTHYGPKTWLIVHPEILLVSAVYRCESCDKPSPFESKTKRELKCGHIREKGQKLILTPNYPTLYGIEWGAVISDESHDTLIVRRGAPTQRRRGMDMLRVRADGLRVCLSGTPFEERPEYLWGTLNWMYPNAYTAFYRWAELYWEKGGQNNGYQLGAFRHEREKMLWDSLSAVAIRRTKKEVASDLPPKTYVGTPLDPADASSPVGVWLPMTGPQQRAYTEMERLSVAQLESGRLEAVTALAEITRLRQLACSYGDIEERKVWVTNDFGKRERVTKFVYMPRLPSNKYDWLVENMETWGFPRKPVTKLVIVSMFTRILELFQESLEKHFNRKQLYPFCTAITGNTPMNQRRKIIDAFNYPNSGPKVMLLNVKAGGTAITLDTADHMVFISETRKPTQQHQAEDRIHRISNPRRCFYWYLRSAETVDVGTALVNQESEQVMRRLLDERRGVDYARQVIGLSHHLARGRLPR